MADDVAGNSAENMAEELAELRGRIEGLEGRGVVDLERLNIVEADGTLRMVLANAALAPDPLVDGQTMNRYSGDAPRIVFYHEHGEECGTARLP